MATRRLARTALDEGVTNALSARGVNTAKELFEHTPLDLSEMLDISVADANRIVLTVAAEVRPEGSDALSLLIKRRSQPTHLHFGLLPLDEALRGGVPAGSVTEVVGPAGAGKTQVCFTLLVNAFRLGGSTVYIDTEARFSASRVVEIARAKWGTDFATDASLEALTRSVVLFTPTTSSELLARLESLEAVIIERAAKLVIVDSVAALVRADGGSLAGGASSREGREARAATLGAQATRLKQLAEAFRIPVVVTNQVTTRLAPQPGFFPQQPATQTSGDAGGGSAGASVDAQLVAALGTKWGHDVNTRLCLEEGGAMGERRLTIVKSAAAPALSFPYSIAAAGPVLSGPGRDASNLVATGALEGGAGRAGWEGAAAAFDAP